MDVNANVKITATATGTDAIERLNRAISGTGSAQDSVVSSGQKLLASLKDQIAAASMGQAEYQLYRASLVGVEKEAAPLISRMEELRAAAVAKAAADARAAAVAKQSARADAESSASREAFLRSLNDQAATLGKSHDEVLAYRAAQLGLTKEAAPMIARIKEANAAMYGSGANARIAANAMRQLPAQFNDVVVSIAGGQNPLMVLLQQGSQVVDSFGGIGNAARSLGALITPTSVALAGAAAAIVAIGVAAYQADSAMERYQRTLLMTGNYAGVTRDKMLSLSAAAKDAAGISIGAAKDVAEAVVASASFGPGTVSEAIKAVALFQKVNGESTEKAVAGFANMRAGVSKWANEAAAKYALIKTSELARIQVIEQTQGREAAMRETLALVNDELARRNVEMEKENGLIGRMIQGWGMLGSEVWNKLKGAFTPATDAQQLDGLRAQLKTAERRLIDSQTKAFATDYEIDIRKAKVEELRREIAAKEQLIQTSERLAEANAREAERAKRYVEEMAKMSEYSSAERGYTDTVSQMRTFEQTAVYELQSAAIQRERNMGLYSEREATQKLYELKVKMLQADEAAAKSAFLRAFYDKTQADATGDTLARIKAASDLEKARLAAGRATLEVQKVLATGSGDTSGQQGIAKLADLERQRAVLTAQLAGLRASGVAPNQGLADGLRIDLADKNNPLFGLDDAMKAKILGVASAVDTLNNSIKTETAGAEFQKRTDAINAETAALGKNARERDVILAKQDLESRGIKEGTVLYEQLMRKRTEAIQAAAESAKDWQFGMKQGINEYLESAGNMAEQTKTVVTQAFTHMEDALVNFAMTGKLNFRDFANAVIADIIRMQVRMAIAGMASSAFSGIGSLFGPSVIGSAKGNAFSGGQTVKAFAKGGAFTNTIATQPTVAPMALFGEAGPEAIMPLARDGSGRLGIRAQGGQGGGDTISVQVVVNMADGSQQTMASGSGNADQARQLGAMVAGLVKQTLVEEKRNPGGLLYSR